MLLIITDMNFQQFFYMYLLNCHLFVGQKRRAWFFLLFANLDLTPVVLNDLRVEMDAF